MTRTEIINTLIKKFGYTSYLEIGLSARVNFEGVECETKVSVDPDPRWGADCVMTSDEYFERNDQGFDIVFIDGLHEADQVYRDFNNSLVMGAKCVVFHDCNPQTKEAQQVPRIQKQWNGDVWKVWSWVAASFPSAYCIDTDEGVGVWQTALEVNFVSWGYYQNMEYKTFARNRRKLLNLISVKKWLEQ